MSARSVIAAVLLGVWVSVGTAQEEKPGTKDAKLFQDVQLPAGDPIPDFVERPWVPPDPDPGKHNKRGTDFGPALSFTVQLGKKEFVRRGLTVRLPGNRAVCYDLDTLAVAATWHGGFLDVSKTHFEDNKGQLPGRPGGPPDRWVPTGPGWADAKGSFADPRKEGLGPLPPSQVSYRGYFLHGYRVILSYSVGGRDVLEMPGAEAEGPAGLVSRTFHVAAGDKPIRLAIARLSGAKVSMREGSKSVALGVVEEKDGRVRGAALAGDGKGGRIAAGGETLALEIPASAEPLNLKLALFAGEKKGLGAFESGVRALPPAMDLRNWVRGGPRRWKETLVIPGAVSKDEGAYVVDTLGLPEENPWKSWFRPAAIDFFSDGRLAVASMNGDVWLATGVDADLRAVRWQRHATGLYEPLGVKVVGDRLYVLGRDRITRLFDLNGDGEADYYQSFFHGGVVAPGYHAFAFDLQTDSKGNFYFVRSGRKVDDTPGHNALIRVSPDGKGWEVVATGFRHPNGMGVGPDDEILVGDNQGEFISSSKVSRVRPGGFYGYLESDKPYEKPLLWLPMKADNSSGGQVWAGPEWGPLSGRLLHTSYGTCKLFYVLLQEGVQATAVPLPFTFASGVMRGRVNPADGQVYVAGLKGWGTAAKEDGCVQRVRYTGKPARLVNAVTFFADGIRLGFTCEVDAKRARELKRYRVERWNYIYSERYGSPEMSVDEPEKKGHDVLAVKSVRVGADGKSVFLEVPGLRPADQMEIAVEVPTADGGKVEAEMHATLHKVPGEKGIQDSSE